ESHVPDRDDAGALPPHRQSEPRQPEPGLLAVAVGFGHADRDTDAVPVAFGICHPDPIAFGVRQPDRLADTVCQPDRLADTVGHAFGNRESVRGEPVALGIPLAITVDLAEPVALVDADTSAAPPEG